jgi:hypothetical protein
VVVTVGGTLVDVGGGGGDVVTVGGSFMVYIKTDRKFQFSKTNEN